MSSKKAGPLTVAQDWLDSHSDSPHTRRKYEAQLQQLCEWLLVRDLDLVAVETLHLSEYIDQLAQGILKFINGNGGPPKARSSKTIALTRSVLRSLFRELVRSGLRNCNPMDQLPPSAAPEAVVNEKSLGVDSIDWIYRRKLLVEAAASKEASQIAKLRAIAVAELAYWVGLKRSEIAKARMSDFSQSEDDWTIKVKRFGHRDMEEIEVPKQVMQAIVKYRLGRKLSAIPAASEVNVPVIARLKSEKFVDPWTVASSLLALDDGMDVSKRKSRPTIIALRRELISCALEASVPTRSLARHLRSEYAVHQIQRSKPSSSANLELERLAA